MNTAGLALCGCATATVFALAAGGCGGAIAPDIGDGGAGSSSGNTGSSSGTSSGVGSSSGIGSSSSSGAGSSSSGGTSSGGISGSSSSGSSSGGSSSGIIGSSSGPNGSIDFEQCIGGGTFCTTSQSNFYASFTQSPSQTTGCTITTTNGCSLYQCTTTGTVPYVSAGTLTISGGSLGAPTTVAPASDESYQYNSTGAFFAPGEQLRVSASGGVVPAFGPVAVVAPTNTTMVAPASPYTVSLKGDLGVQWTGGAAGSVFVLEGITQNNQTYFLCEWDAGMGKNFVPQSTLSGIGSGSGYLIYGQYSSATFTAGTYTIYDSALSYGGGTATFQ
jgi:hypothetical protein